MAKKLSEQIDTTTERICPICKRPNTITRQCLGCDRWVCLLCINIETGYCTNCLIPTAPSMGDVDLHYKQGFVECLCGWKKELGDGSNGHYILLCPDCTPNLSLRLQEKVMYGTPKNMTVELGYHYYFTIEQGLSIRYKSNVWSKQTGLSIRRAANV